MPLTELMGRRMDLTATPSNKSVVADMAHFFAGCPLICESVAPFITVAVEAALTSSLKLPQPHLPRQDLAYGRIHSVFDDSPEVQQVPLSTLGENSSDVTAMMRSSQGKVSLSFQHKTINLRFQLSELVDASIQAFELFRCDPLHSFQQVALSAFCLWLGNEFHAAAVEFHSPSATSSSYLRAAIPPHIGASLCEFCEVVDVRVDLLPSHLLTYAIPSVVHPLLSVIHRPQQLGATAERRFHRFTGPHNKTKLSEMVKTSKGGESLFVVTGTVCTLFLTDAAALSEDYLAICNVSVKHHRADVNVAGVVTTMCPTSVTVCLANFKPVTSRSALVSPGMRVSFMCTISTLESFLGRSESKASYPPPCCLGPLAVVPPSPFSPLCHSSSSRRSYLEDDGGRMKMMILDAVAAAAEMEPRVHHYAATLTDDFFATFGVERSSWREAVRMWRDLGVAWSTAHCCTPGWYIPSEHGIELPTLWACSMMSASIPSASMRVCLRLPNNKMATELRSLMIAAASSNISPEYHVISVTADTTEAQLLPSLKIEKTKLPLPCPQTTEVLRIGVLNHVGGVLFIPDLATTSAGVLRTIARFHDEGHVSIPRASNDVSSASATSLVECPVHCGCIGIAIEGSLPPAAVNFVQTSTIALAVQLPAAQASVAGCIRSQVLYLQHRHNSRMDAAHVTFADGTKSHLTPWDHLRQILHEDTRKLCTLPKLSVPATGLLESYFAGLRAAFPDSVEASKIRSLIQLASSHAVLRVAWNTPPHFLEPLLASGIDVFPIDAIVAIAITDASLSKVLGAPMLELGTLLTVAVGTLRVVDMDENSCINFRDSTLATDDVGSYELVDDDSIIQWFSDIQERILGCN